MPGTQAPTSLGSGEGRWWGAPRAGEPGAEDPIAGIPMHWLQGSQAALDQVQGPLWSTVKGKETWTEADLETRLQSGCKAKRQDRRQTYKRQDTPSTGPWSSQEAKPEAELEASTLHQSSGKS